MRSIGPVSFINAARVKTSMANTPSTWWPLYAGYPLAISLATSGKCGELVMRTQCSVSPPTARSAVRPKSVTEMCPASIVTSAQLPMEPPRPRASAGVVKAMKYTRLPFAPNIAGARCTARVARAFSACCSSIWLLSVANRVRIGLTNHGLSTESTVECRSASDAFSWASGSCSAVIASMSITPSTTRSCSKSMSPRTSAIVLDTNSADLARSAAARRCCATTGMRRSRLGPRSAEVVIGATQQSRGKLESVLRGFEVARLERTQCLLGFIGAGGEVRTSRGGRYPETEQRQQPDGDEPTDDRPQTNCRLPDRRCTANNVSSRTGATANTELHPKCHLLPSLANTCRPTPNTAAATIGPFDPRQPWVHGAVAIVEMHTATAA